MPTADPYGNGCSFKKDSNKLQQIMNRFRFQLTIFHLMLATFAVAVFCVLFVPFGFLYAPFDPEVTFHTTILPDAEITNGGQSPVGIVQIKNHGVSAIWYQGKTGRVTSFFSASGPGTRKVIGCMTVDYAAGWTKLKPGDTAYARFPIGNTSDKIHFGFTLQDKRGRRAWRSTGQLQDVSLGFGTRMFEE